MLSPLDFVQHHPQKAPLMTVQRISHNKVTKSVVNTQCFLPKTAIRIYLEFLAQCQLCSFWLQRKGSGASQVKKEGPLWSNTEGICNLWMMAKVTRKACHVPAEIAHAHVLNALKHLLGTFSCGQTSGIIKLLSFSWQRRLKTKKRRGEKVERISASSGDAFQPAWTELHPPWMLQHIPSLWPDIFSCLVHQCPAKYVVPPLQCGMHHTIPFSQLWIFPRSGIFIRCCSLLTVLKNY